MLCLHIKSNKRYNLSTRNVENIISFLQGRHFVTSCLFSCTPSSFWRGVYSKRKESAPQNGANSVLLEKTPFSEGKQKQF